MRELFFIEDSVANKISYWHLTAFLIALPFDFFYSEIILISFALHTLIHIRKESLKKIFHKSALIPMSIFLFGLAAVSYSPDKSEGFNITTRQLAIIIMPVLFALTSLDIEKYRLNLMAVFGLACTATVLYLYVDAVRIILHFHLPVSSLFTVTFMNHNFSAPIKIHATYLSLYTAFSLLVFLYMIFKKQDLHQRWIYIISAAILSAGILQLSSRAVFIAFLVSILVGFPFLMFNGKKRWAFFFTALCISVLVLIGIYNTESFKERYISELGTDLTNNVKLIENTEPRLARWNAILELIRQSPAAGYGTGAEKELLKETYFKKGLYISYLNEFNTHNEYLSVLLKTGIMGLLLFMYVLYFGFATAVKKKNILFFSFMVLVTIVSVSENILDLNKGIFFYSFFFSFFLWDERVYIKNLNEDLAKDKATNNDFTTIKTIAKEKKMQALSVVIITYNEEKNIGRCIASVRKVADEIIVVDSFSDDETVNIATSMGAMVKQSSFGGYIKQKNKAISLAANNYVLLLDADEALSDELANDILAVKNDFEFKAYRMKRCNIFCGKHIRHGLWYPDKKLRLFDKRYGTCGGLNPHDKIIMQDGIGAKLLKGDILHYTFNSISEYRKRNEEVSTVIAQSIYDAGIKKSGLKIIFSPLWTFINGYLLRLGFLEGYAGFVIAVHTAHQSFQKYRKLRQLYRQEVTEMVWD